MSAPGPPKAIKTPCVAVCTISTDSGLCYGCHRTLAEIATWARLTDAERDRILAELPTRQDGAVTP